MYRNIINLVKLKNAQTDRKIPKKEENQIDSIQVKSSRKKKNISELGGNSKTDVNLDLKLNTKGRKDSRGVPILKGNKNHKLSYADNLYGTNLAIIINVESYKEYNAIEFDTGRNDSSNNRKKDGVSCKCSIL